MTHILIYRLVCNSLAHITTLTHATTRDDALCQLMRSRFQTNQPLESSTTTASKLRACSIVWRTSESRTCSRDAVDGKMLFRFSSSGSIRVPHSQAKVQAAKSLSNITCKDVTVPQAIYTTLPKVFAYSRFTQPNPARISLGLQAFATPRCMLPKVHEATMSSRPIFHNVPRVPLYNVDPAFRNFVAESCTISFRDVRNESCRTNDIV